MFCSRYICVRCVLCCCLHGVLKHDDDDDDDSSAITISAQVSNTSIAQLPVTDRSANIQVAANPNPTADRSSVRTPLIDVNILMGLSKAALQLREAPSVLQIPSVIRLWTLFPSALCGCD